MAAGKPGATKRRVLTIVGALLLVAAGFAGGYLYYSQSASARYYGMPVATKDAQTAQSASELAQRIEEVSIVLADESYNPPSTDMATSAAIQALLRASGDEYARYYTTEQYKSYVDKMSGEYAGIGVLLSEYKGSAYVVHVYPGSPAAAAGLQEGDFITSINGVTKVSWGLEEVTSLISSTEGTTIDLGWRRPESIDGAGGQTFSATIQFATIEIPNVTYRLTEEGIGYISVAQFTSDVTGDVEAAIKDLEGQGAVGYILDLRSNPGGYVTQAVEVASCFMSSGVVVGVQSRTSGVTEKSVTDNHMTDKPLAILVNRDSASASEIVAAALKSSKRGTVIGTTTFGKGTVQAYRELTFGGAIKYTIAHYLTPDGEDIEGVGVTPDIAVDMDATLIGTTDDTQYSTAVTFLLDTVSAAQAAVTPAADEVTQDAQASS